MENDLRQNDIEIVERYCLACVGGALRRILKDREQAYENLSNVQTRCTELLDRTRMMTPEDVKTVARDVLSGHSRSYVIASETLAKWIMDGTLR